MNISFFFLIILIFCGVIIYLCHKANLVDWGNPVANAIDGFNRLFCTYFHRLTYTPLPLPEQGSAILVANHISGLDPLLLIAAARRPVRFLIAHEEYSRFGFTWIYRLAGCIPVERERNPERAFKAALQALEKGEVVALFPEGGIHTRDAPAKHLKTGAIRLSYLADVPIYPAHIQGVRGEGSVFLAVLMRSRAVISHHAPIVCEKAHSKHCLDHIREIIQRPVGRL